MAVTYIKKKHGPRAKIWYFVAEHYSFKEGKGWTDHRVFYGVVGDNLISAWQMFLTYIKVSYYPDQYSDLLALAHYSLKPGDGKVKIKMVN